MSHSTNQRKHDHLQTFRRDPDVERHKHYFDAIHLTHRALPEIALADVDASVEFLSKRLSFPLLISSMTGGSEPIFQKINRNLALAAEAEGVALGVGSQRVMFAASAARKSFELRRYAPTAPLLANLGAVQLNYGFGLAECRAAVAALQADALILHLNPLQEAIQREGDTDFRGLASKVGKIARALGKPVIVKEVGAGLSLADALLLVKNGVKILDVAGTGGTSWSRIEHHRRAATDAADDLGLVFQDWGLPTPLALWALRSLRKKVTLIASGGIRSGLDTAKAVVLGASLCGVAAPLLKPAQESAEAVRAVIQRLRREFITAMFLLGCRNVNALCGNDRLLQSA
ncbi:MAG: type 2 isopentenyl-diphosphate Delta-isomerase [Verrucomicrobia bacterium]|nr:MAG: type 2 isopentenyl-diphosphate Delta-isomerase [Verrucomicrobiota bacterium]